MQATSKFMYPTVKRRPGIIGRIYQEWFFFEVRDERNDIQFFANCSINNPGGVKGGFPRGCDFAGAIIMNNVPRMTSKDSDYMTKFTCASNVLDINLGDRAFIVADGDRIHFHGTDPTMNVSFDLSYANRLPSWQLRHVKMGTRPFFDKMWYSPAMVAATVIGTITVDGTEYHVSGETGYHDHWWGSPTQFRWSPWVNVNKGDFEIVSNTVNGKVGFCGACTQDTWFDLGVPRVVVKKNGIDKTLDYEYPTEFTIAAKKGGNAIDMTVSERGAHAGFDVGMGTYKCNLIWSWNYVASGVITRKDGFNKEFDEIPASVYHASNFDLFALARAMDKEKKGKKAGIA